MEKYIKSCKQKYQISLCEECFISYCLFVRIDALPPSLRALRHVGKLTWVEPVLKAERIWLA